MAFEPPRFGSCEDWRLLARLTLKDKLANDAGHQSGGAASLFGRLSAKALNHHVPPPMADEDPELLLAWMLRSLRALRESNVYSWRKAEDACPELTSLCESPLPPRRRWLRVCVFTHATALGRHQLDDVAAAKRLRGPAGRLEARGGVAGSGCASGGGVARLAIPAWPRCGAPVPRHQGPRSPQALLRMAAKSTARQTHGRSCSRGHMQSHSRQCRPAPDRTGGGAEHCLHPRRVSERPVHLGQRRRLKAGMQKAALTRARPTAGGDPLARSWIRTSDA